MFTRSANAWLRIATAALAWLIMLAKPLDALSAGSAHYLVTADSLDAGGSRAGSAAYKSDGSFGTFGGVSRSASAQHVVKHGYAGQLYEVTGLRVGCSNTNLNEATTHQLVAQATLDDHTVMNVGGTRVRWQAMDGPISIGPGGLSRVDFVYQDTRAVVCGEFGGQTNLLALSIRNIGRDDCGAYAGDGLDDEWQARYFGENSFVAAPAADPDGDGQNNLFEFAAGMNPTDVGSRFALSISAAEDLQNHRRIVLSPCFSDRIYAVEYSDSLAAGQFTRLPGATETESGLQRTFIDSNASSPARFYRVLVSPR